MKKDKKKKSLGRKIRNLVLAFTLAAGAWAANDATGYQLFNQADGDNIFCEIDPTCRKLTEGEIALARQYFGDSIDYRQVNIFNRPHFFKDISGLNSLFGSGEADDTSAETSENARASDTPRSPARIPAGTPVAEEAAAPRPAPESVCPMPEGPAAEDIIDLYRGYFSFSTHWQGVGMEIPGVPDRAPYAEGTPSADFDPSAASFFGNIHNYGAEGVNFDDMSQDAHSAAFFLHEMAHVAQYQTNSLSTYFNNILADFPLSAERYEYDLDDHESYYDYSNEQQAEMVEDLFEARQELARRLAENASVASIQSQLEKFMALEDKVGQAHPIGCTVPQPGVS